MLMFAVLLATTALLQWRAGGFAGTFTGDAAAHYVSGLMAHDWLQDRPGSNPVQYLINYHAHLPLTAFGLWPPFYYGIEALWMLLIGIGVPAMLWLSGSITALLGLTVGLVAERRTGWIGGLLAGLLIVGNPLVQRASNELMLDVANALACFLAALAYAAYLVRGRRGAAMLGFGMLAATAMMIKYNAVALAFLPPLCVLIGRRWDLLRRPSFYTPAVIVGVLAGPWYVMTHGLAEQGFQFSWGMAYLKLATLYNAGSIIEGLTPPIALLALIGLVRVFWRGGRSGMLAPVEIACAALGLSMFLFLLAVPIALQDRYLIPCLAPLLVLAAHEAMWLFERLRRPIARGAWVAVLITSVVTFAWTEQSVPHDRLHEAAQAALEALPPSNPVVLLVADGTIEPALIAAIAMAEPQRPMAWVIRGSRLFGGGGYNNADYQPRFTDPRALLEELNRYGVSLVIFRRTGAVREWTHVAQFGAMLAAAPEQFEAVAEIPGPVPIRILRVLGNEARHPDVAALTHLNGPQALLRMVQ
jgi:hypothetical protein